MKLVVLCALTLWFLTLKLTGADASGPIPLRTIARGAFSAIQQPAQLVITNQAAWDDLWKKHSAQQSPQKPPPAVDFSKETILFVALGRKNTGGYSISIETLRPKGPNILVKVITKSPKPGGFTLQALSAPFHIVAVEATGKKFVFEQSEAAPEKE